MKQNTEKEILKTWSWGFILAGVFLLGLDFGYSLFSSQILSLNYLFFNNLLTKFCALATIAGGVIGLQQL